MDVKSVLPSIPEWFAGKNILITGATGFMGKVLVEKLLRDCPDVAQLYLLIRPKRGVEPAQRREDYINHFIFENVRKSDAKQMQKIKTVKGDVSLECLGIDAADRTQLIANVDVVFHCAANVRFDQPLKDAVNLNTLGTNRVLKLAEEMTRLKVFVHVSTAYCQCNEDVLEERGYSAPHSPLGIAKMTQLLDDEVLSMITPKLLKGLPNTYAYTKALTEDLVSSYDNRIPIVITRPSIVTAAWKEPYPGWVEGMNGPTGLMIGAARGVVRSMHCNPDLPSDVVPVDTAINAIVAAAWERGLNETKKIQYVNITLPQEKQLTWGESVEKGKEFFYKNPLCFSLWYPAGSIKSNYFHHIFCVIFFHYLPAYFIDALLVLLRKKPFLVQVQKRVSQGLKVLQYYTTRNWVFKNDNMMQLHRRMNQRDRERFNFNVDEINWDDYIGNYILGARHFLLKEKPETLPSARKLLRKLYLLDKFVHIMFYVLIIWMFYSYWDTILYSFEAMFDVSQNYFSQRGKTARNAH
ncbi:putative fatty acyl-CoA reductase CG5065 [Bradysia coprophila]|uniref:putative fatty acyl-CoA reductase CG5065 n=1 Tax=Bradysia coprophila TaxID=38358 RepID=UPI00187DB7F0|nr:putative fatty acyl-CoA reductase CG5065 [Bradysia coprophila]XP_037039619.1 putative fatty acyl-CoA reductase CG5065 [Bradysia coprophila]XP_037039621.1 putative fatty acyl-CoA reductase CG5065 [Bradysia coprophila]XP_037039622.1 putative fatty acyl-CoA reductase CG5065 [Bradysia coprophila]XP_037039623.1 putative fatty acyl-CoA reductase CG5065 [Bradysia coprophila]